MNRKRFALLVTLFAVCGAGATYYFVRWNPVVAVPSVPEIPTVWTDPPIVEIAGLKRRAVLANDRSGSAWGEYGMVFDAHDRPDESKVCYQTAMRLSPKDARWPYFLGQFYRDENTDRCIELYQQSSRCELATPSDRLAINMTLADYLMQHERRAEAQDIYRRSFELDRNNPWAALRWGQTVAEQDNEELAMTILASLKANVHARKRAATAIAMIHRRAGRSKQAEQFEYISSSFPDDQSFINPLLTEIASLQRGWSVMMRTLTQLESQRNYPAALQTARRMVDLYPSAKNQMILGRAYVNVADYDSAIPELEDAVRGDPKLMMAHAFLGIAWFHRADGISKTERTKLSDEYLQKSIVHLERAVEMKADYAPGYYYLARAMLRQNRPNDALRAIQNCIQSRPEEWEGYVIWGEALAMSGNKSEAIRVTEQAVSLANPSDPRPKLALEKIKAWK